MPYAMKIGTSLYYYITNLQGDVLGLIDSNGNSVASYTYDPYGKVLTAAGILAGKNPLRYRGYYYDSESGLYYLLTRYYDPNTCRFINADGQLSLGDFTGMNLFAYCGNNPVNRIDSTGEEWWHWALGITAAIAAVALTVVTLGAAAPAATCTLTLIGTSLGLGSTAASVLATAFVVTTTVVTAAYMGDMVLSAFTGESVLLDTVFQGNEAAYETGQFLASYATYGMIEMAANNPGVCFAAGTLISTEKGNIPIEDISIGDMVYASNPETGEVAYLGE